MFYFSTLLQIPSMSGFVENSWIPITGSEMLTWRKLAPQISSGKGEDSTNGSFLEVLAMWNLSHISETSLPVILKSTGLSCILNGSFCMHDSLTSCIYLLENTASLSYADLQNFN